MRDIDVHARSLEPLEPLLEPGRWDELRERASAVRDLMDGRTVWNVSATATGGGVAEMLQSLLGGVVEAGIDARWLVLEAEDDFFVLTKRIHNHLHGSPGDGGALGEDERTLYDEALASEASSLAERLSPGDVVLLHDPQTAGLVGAVLEAGAVPVWRCHIGLDEDDEHTDAAWAFLRPDVERAAAIVLSRAQYAQDWMEPEKTVVIAPAIDPFAVKNVVLDDAVVQDVLVRAGILAGSASSDAAAEVDVGAEKPVRVERRADVLREGDPWEPGTPMVVQVSRWDRLKDMQGLLELFAERVVGSSGGADEACLALVGPSVEGVSDDPEGAQVLQECRDAWHALAPEQRRRCALVSLPMDDVDENAVMVGALQRHAAVVVQKSLVEGFGLTVAEAMWKSRPVVASSVGGIADQVEDGVSGRLVPPREHEQVAAALREVLGGSTGRGADAEQLGEAARERVRDRFLPDRQLLEWARLVERLA